MAEAQEILQLRFEGNGISPDSVKPSEIAEMINEFQNALLSTIKAEHPEIDINELLFSLEAIKNESLGINFKTVQENLLKQVKDAVVSSYLLIATTINTKDFTPLSSNTIQSLKKISAFAKRHNCNGQFNIDGETISTITPATEIKELPVLPLRGTATVYGQIVDVGSNIHLKLNDGNTVLIDVDKSVSKYLGTRLWDIVGIRGVAKWDPLTFKISDFKFLEIIDFAPGNLTKTFADLKKLTSGVWDKFNNNDDINKQLLRD